MRKKDKKMKNNIKVARIVGVLFIIATVAYSLGLVLLDPILGSSTLLTDIVANQNIVIIGVLLVLINAVTVAAIAIAIYPILKIRRENLAIGYVGARLCEGILFCISTITTLTLFTLSQKLVDTGIVDDSYYQILGTVLLTAGNWASLLGLGLAFSLSAMILNIVLFQTKLVPQWLSAWGFAGAVLVFANFTLEIFGISPVEALFLPIAVQEMVFAVWLIVKGFDSSAIASESE
jgi:hypothetical protein